MISDDVGERDYEKSRDVLPCELGLWFSYEWNENEEACASNEPTQQGEVNRRKFECSLLYRQKREAPYDTQHSQR